MFPYVLGTMVQLIASILLRTCGRHSSSFDVIDHSEKKVILELSTKRQGVFISYQLDRSKERRIKRNEGKNKIVKYSCHSISFHKIFKVLWIGSNGDYRVEEHKMLHH